MKYNKTNQGNVLVNKCVLRILLEVHIEPIACRLSGREFGLNADSTIFSRVFFFFFTTNKLPLEDVQSLLKKSGIPTYFDVLFLKYHLRALYYG